MLAKREWHYVGASPDRTLVPTVSTHRNYCKVEVSNGVRN